MNGGLTVVYGVIVASLLGIAYQALGGRALLGLRERPARLIGTRIQLRPDDGLEGVAIAALPAAVVDRFDGEKYRALFASPFEYEGRNHEWVEFSARHAGYPVSRAGRRSLVAVNATLAGGQPFIARIVRV